MIQGQCYVHMSNTIGHSIVDTDGIHGYLQKYYLLQVMPLFMVNM